MIDSEEIDEVVQFETIEEAVMRIRERLPPNSCVLLHAEDCTLDEDTGEPCDCTPILIERTEEQS